MRAAALESELSSWKQAHAVAVERVERESKAHNVQIAALNRQISSMYLSRGVRLCGIVIHWYAIAHIQASESRPSGTLRNQWGPSFVLPIAARRRFRRRSIGCSQANSSDRWAPRQGIYPDICPPFLLGHSVF